MDSRASRVLGRSGLEVGGLGISSSYRAPAAAYEEAFERGCNYFSWGTFVKGRAKAMREAVRSIVARGRRDDLVLALLTYAHVHTVTSWRLGRALDALGTDRVDVLLLGYYGHVPPPRILDGAQKLVREGRVRFVGLTSHRRAVFQEAEAAGGIDVIHVRYNAAHRGAEEDVFPHVDGPEGPGVVSFTATDWGRLLDPKRMPAGEPPLTAAECYRFALHHPAVDACMTGPKTLEQMRENLSVLDQPPLSDDELGRIRRIGDHVYGR